MIVFRLLRSRGTRESFLTSFHRREKSSSSVKTANWPPLYVFSGFGPRIEKVFPLTMFRDIKLQFKLLSRRDSYIV